MVAVNVCGPAVWNLLHVFILALIVGCYVLGKFVNPFVMTNKYAERCIAALIEE
jgi:hypothetical protein